MSVMECDANHLLDPSIWAKLCSELLGLLPYYPKVT